MQVEQEDAPPIIIISFPLHKRQPDGRFYCPAHLVPLRSRPVRGRYYCPECPEGEGEHLVTNEIFSGLVDQPQAGSYSLGWTANHNPFVRKVCSNCGAPFETKSPNRKYCTEKCRRVAQESKRISVILGRLLGASLD